MHVHPSPSPLLLSLTVFIIVSRVWQVGYTAASVLFAPGDDSIPLILETIRHDLHSTQDTVQALALSLIANLGGPELGDALVADVARLLSG